MKKYWRKIILILVLLVAAYLLIPCVFIPLHHKAVSEPASLQLPNVPQSDADRAACIDDNREALLRRLQVIASAREEIIFSTFKLFPDESGYDIMSALMDAADRGVKVRIVIDGMNPKLNLKNDAVFQTLTCYPNIEVREYNHFNLAVPWRLNYRLHDKYIIADRNVYILGGRNARNVSLGDYQEKKDYDRDILVYNASRSTASSLYQVRDYFESVWALPATKPICSSKHPDADVTADMRRHYQQLCLQYPEIGQTTDWSAITVPTNGIMLLSNPIEAQNKEPLLWNSLMQLMEQGSDILIQTPYLICNKGMYRELEHLTQNRNVRIVTNSPESGGNIFGTVDYLNQKKHITRLGAEIYEYVGDRSCHTKSVLIDDSICVVGSFNFDMRSAYLDTETMLVINSPELNRQMRQTGQHFMDSSRCTAPDGTETPGKFYEPKEISTGKKIVFGISRLLVPLVRHLA